MLGGLMGKHSSNTGGGYGGGGYPQQQVVYQQAPPPKKSGIGMGGLALGGASMSPVAAGRMPAAVCRPHLTSFAFRTVGGGLLGGLLIADAIDDFGDNNDNNGA